MTAFTDTRAGEPITLNAALAVIAAHRPVETDAAKAKRRQRIADWHMHADACDGRAREYLTLAAELPKAHRDHEYYTHAAADQMQKAQYARWQIKIEEKRL